MKDSVKKLLILAYRFPPFAGTSATRIACFAKYLSEYGWEPSVVTADWREDNCEQFDAGYGERLSRWVAARVPVRDIRRSSTAGKRPDQKVMQAVKREIAKHRNTRDWVRHVQQVVPRVIETHGPFDAMLATAPPWSVLQAASWIADRYHIPWIADFRDVFEESVPKRLWGLQARREQRWLRDCRAIVTVSDPLAEKLRGRHQAPVHVVPNGYDPEDYEEAKKDALGVETGVFRIVYTGMLYPVGHPARESPRVLLAALDSLAEGGFIDLEDFEIDLIGTPRAKALPHLKGFRSADRVNIIEWVERQDAYRRQASATLLLLLGSSQIAGILTAKVFEYLASGRPILTVPSDGDCLDALLASTRAGWSATTPDQCAAVIKQTYSTWRANGELPPVSAQGGVTQFSRRVQTGMLAEHLHRISDPVS